MQNGQVEHLAMIRALSAVLCPVRALGELIWAKHTRDGVRYPNPCNEKEWYVRRAGQGRGFADALTAALGVGLQLAVPPCNPTAYVNTHMPLSLCRLNTPLFPGGRKHDSDTGVTYETQLKYITELFAVGRL